MLEKALAFREEDRFQTAEELAVMLDSCEDNKYLDAQDGAREIFRKGDEDLSDMEKLMMSIISGEEPEDEESAAPETDDVPTVPVQEVSAEEAMEEILADQAPEKPDKDPVAESAEDLVAEFFGTKLADEKEAAARIRPIIVVPSEPEDVRVYEPGKEKRQPIPILTEEKNPVLAPVVPRSAPRRQTQTVKYSDDPVRSEKIGQEVQKRRKRPVLVVLLLCVLLLGL